MLGVLLRLGRVSNLPTTWTNVLAGVYLSGARPDTRTLVLIALAASLFYVGGMYLNDAFDREIDAKERPERPIPSGRISAAAVFSAGFGMLLSGLLVVTWIAWNADAGAGAVVAAAALGAMIVFYDMFHKGNPLSPLVMGLCRVLVYGVAALAAGGRPEGLFWFGCAALLCYLIGLTYVAKQENLREFRGAWPLLFLAVPFTYPLVYAAALEHTAGLVFYGALAAWIVYTLGFLLRPQRRNIPRAVGHFIAGISLLDGLLIAGQGQALVAGTCALAWLLTLILQRVVPGT